MSLKSYRRADGVIFRLGDEVEVTNPSAEPGTQPPKGRTGVIVGIYPHAFLDRLAIEPHWPGGAFAVNCFSHINPFKKINESILKVQEFLKTKKHGIDYVINKKGLFEKPKSGESNEKK